MQNELYNFSNIKLTYTETSLHFPTNQSGGNYREVSGKLIRRAMAQLYQLNAGRFKGY